jgi:putative ABC transport system substrate-binding protein
MKRRSLLAGSAAAVLAAPMPLRAQGRRRVGVLTNMARGDPVVEAIFTRLAELGWSERRNLTVEYLVIEPDGANIDAQARSLAKFKPDVLFTNITPAALALKAAAPAIPMVFNLGGDPVALGLVRILARPGGPATGLTQYSYQTGVKLYGLLKELAPEARRVAVMYEAGNESLQQAYEALRRHPATAAVQWQVFRLRDWRDVDAANLALMRDPAEGLIVLNDQITSTNGPSIIGLANARRLPAIYGSRYRVADGGLLSFGIDGPKQYIRCAEYIARILDGAKPADLPVEQPTQFELVVNLGVAKLMGIEVPQSILLQANEVIQ